MLKLSLICKKYLFWAVLGLSIFIPLYPKFPLFNVPGTYVAIRLEDFLIAVVVLWWFLAILPNLKSFLSSNLFQVVALFWVIGGLSLFSAIFLTQTVSPHLGLLHYLRRVESMILLFVAYSAFTSLAQVKDWLKVMFFTTLMVVIYGFGQQWLSFPVISTTNREFSKGLILFLSPEARVNSTFAGHYDLAGYLAVVLILLAGMFLYVRNIIKKALIGLTGALSFLLLALTAARASFVAAILGISLAFFLLGQKKLILILLGASLLALVISPDLRHRSVATLTVNLLGGGGPKYTPPPQKPNSTKAFSIENAADGVATPAGVPVDVAPGEPLNTTELGVYRSFGIRLDEEWPRAIRAWLKNPLLGTGYSSITISTDNDYLRSLGETGLLGTASLVLVFWLILKKMWGFIKKSAKNLPATVIIGLFSGVLSLLVTALVIDILESSKIAQLLWLSLGVALATVKMVEVKNENK